MSRISFRTAFHLTSKMGLCQGAFQSDCPTQRWGRRRPGLSLCLRPAGPFPATNLRSCWTGLAAAPISCSAPRVRSPVRCGWSDVVSGGRPGPDPRASSSVITCGISISNMGSIDFRLTEIFSYVKVLRNRYNWSGGDKRPPFGGLHYVGLH